MQSKASVKRYHILFDIDREATEPQVRTILEELPPLIGMKTLYGPVIIQGVPENPGVTGFVIIDYSHISIHTFTDTVSLIDVFSCKFYDRDIVTRYLQDIVGGHVSTQVVQFGDTEISE